MKARVPKHQNPREFVLVETAATIGATLGVNVFNQDGRLYVPPDSATPAGATGAPGSMSAADKAKLDGVPILTSGTYTPTLTNETNIGASTAYVCQWMRVGNVVTVSGKVDVDPTAATVISNLGISLPIASGLPSVSSCAGTAFCTEDAQGGGIYGNTVAARAEMRFNATVNTNQPMYFSFTYLVV